ncbi:MAG: 2-oxo acid dehydrogenase subunit E2 [Bacteroidetes bacterium]|nr:2-oxo acid dehydrogenase subunit E2 [Bacteroidota bacterium]
MALAELIMPKMGESIMEATILKWLKQPGDAVALDEPVLEIATDKVDSEVPSPFAGVLVEMRFPEGETVEIGKIIAVIATEGEQIGAGHSPAAAASPTAQEVPTADKVEASVAQAVAAAKPAASAPQPVALSSNGSGSYGAASPAAAPASSAARFYSPLVLNIAREEGISMTELEAMPGTGSEGRVTKRDILDYVQSHKTGASPAVKPAVASSGSAASPAASPAGATPAQSPSPVAGPVSASPSPTPSPARVSAEPMVSGNVEIVEMDRMRKMIAEHMVRSKHTSPHVTSFVEADMTPIVQWRERIKKSFEQKTGEKITFTPIIIEAIVKAIRDFPMVNVSVDGDRILVKKDINIGMAAALPNGNLIVPVIKRADQLNLLGLTRAVNDLANRARLGKLKPEEVQDGTYTVTNVGTFGNVMGTPVINQPQVAIMAAGAIRKKPAVIETPQGDFIGIRHMMFLSHAYDHRVVDGFLGGSFVRRVADYLEGWDPNREF